MPITLRQDQALHDVSQKEPSETLLKFVNLYVEGTPPAEAWVLAGYSEATKYTAKAKLRENWKLIEKMVDLRIGSHVPEALSIVVGIMRNTSYSPTIRLKAAQDVLSRAGKDKPIQLQHTSKEAEDLPDQDLDTEIKEILQKLGINA